MRGGYDLAYGPQNPHSHHGAIVALDDPLAIGALGLSQEKTNPGWIYYRADDRRVPPAPEWSMLWTCGEYNGNRVVITVYGDDRRAPEEILDIPPSST